MSVPYVGAIIDRPPFKFQFIALMGDNVLFLIRQEKYQKIDYSQSFDGGRKGGSDGSAASGGRSDLSEWQRSKFCERTANRKFRAPQQDPGEGGSKPG